MKKKLFLTIAMISVLILTGCQKETENSSVPQGESNSVKSIENDTLINNNFLYPEIAVYNENGAYLPVYSGIDGSYVVSYIDFESKSYIEVCSSVVCMHNSTECTAYISPNVGGVDLEIAKDYLKSTLKTINKNNEIVEVSKLNFHGTPSSTFIRIIDKDYIVVDNTTFDPKINDAITKRYSISLKEENITEINLNYFFDGRTRPMFVFGTTSKYAFGVINYKAEKLSGTDQAGNIFYYDAATPIYGIFEKKII